MNKKQQIVVAMAVACVALSGLFPPYEGEYRREGDNLKRYIGYRFLFAPPSEEDVCRIIHGKEPSDPSDFYLSKSSSQIITSRVWVQIVTIVIAATGIVLLLGDKKQIGSSNHISSSYVA